MMRSLLAIFFVVALISCKKDGDNAPPIVHFISHVDGLQADIYDIIHCEIQVSDNENLAYLDVRLVTTSQVPVMATRRVNTSGTGGTLIVDYDLYDGRVLSGQYYLEAKIYDAEGNEDHEFVLINLTETPLVLRGIYAATTMPGFVSVYKVDTSWTSDLYASFTSDFTDLAVSSYWDQIAISGSFTGLFRS